MLSARIFLICSVFCMVSYLVRSSLLSCVSFLYLEKLFGTSTCSPLWTNILDELAMTAIAGVGAEGLEEASSSNAAMYE